MSKLRLATAETAGVSSGQLVLQFGEERAAEQEAGNVFELPTVKPIPKITASSHKAAGRLNASAISVEEIKAWLDEREALLNKKFSGEMTRKDENRLSYVRWSLDRIEDAKYGENMDNLENRVVMYERLLDEVRSFTMQLEMSSNSRKK